MAHSVRARIFFGRASAFHNLAWVTWKGYGVWLLPFLFDSLILLKVYGMLGTFLQWWGRLSKRVQWIDASCYLYLGANCGRVNRIASCETWGLQAKKERGNVCSPEAAAKQSLRNWRGTVCRQELALTYCHRLSSWLPGVLKLFWLKEPLANIIKSHGTPSLPFPGLTS